MIYHFSLTEEYQAATAQTNNLTDIKIYILLLHPESVGEVKLKSNDPIDKPIINPKFFSNDADIETMYEAIQFILEMNETETFQKFGAEVIVLDSPLCDDEYEKLSDEWWSCNIMAFSASVNVYFRENL